eukprot:CAMPEP_0168612154 /NCGR_PEP_ID=MMETSP0449_2-20121227/2755_1 /TAXON_ID=1082188 /ORGANISM="Strombidium rassoulzadegani, Strain ras09" /LENGTH=167 /DNA_ID=CAMNT_0008652679 /DNA_START=534 /DNA_END=1037 /DNA_ORIENTATION=-
MPKKTLRAFLGESKTALGLLDLYRGCSELRGSTVVSELKCPLSGGGDGFFFVRLPEVGNLTIEFILQLWINHEAYDAEEDNSDTKNWRPLMLQNIEAYSSQLVDVGVVDLSSEEHLGGLQGILLWEEELAFEEATLVGSVRWARELDEEVSKVLLADFNLNSINCKA